MSAGIGHNQPSPLDRARDLIETTNRWRRERKSIGDKDTAGTAQEFLGQLRANHADLEAAKKAERKPIDEALAAVRAKYNDPLALVALSISGMRDLLAPWLQREEARLINEADERRQQLEVAQAEAARALEQARKSGTVEDELAMQRAAQHVDKAKKAAAKPVERPSVRGDPSARATGLRTIWFAEVVDEDAALRSFAKDPEVRAVALVTATRLATKLAQSTKGEGQCPRGFEFRSKQVPT